MTDPGDAARLWADRSFLRNVQCKTDVNLAARQSIYAYQEPPIDLAREILSLAGLSGHEVVADIGCGNGPCLAELARRLHAGPVVGADLSPGMLQAARRRAPEAGLLTADATALPFADAAVDLTLATHMLYHVPEPDRAVRELRRITRPGGRLIVSLNGQDHLRELRDVVAAALASLGRAPSSLLRERISLDRGEVLLRSAFTSVTRHDFKGQLRVPSPEPIVAYVRSMREAASLPDPEPLLKAVASRLRAAPGAFLRITTHSGCLVCADPHRLSHLRLRADVVVPGTAGGVGAQLTVWGGLQPGDRLGWLLGYFAGPVILPATERDGHSRTDGHQHARSGHNLWPAPPGRSDLWAGLGDIYVPCRGYERLVDLRRDGVLEGEATPLDARRGPDARLVDARPSPLGGAPDAVPCSRPGGLRPRHGCPDQGGRPGQLLHALARLRRLGLGYALSAQDRHVNLLGVPSLHTCTPCRRPNHPIRVSGQSRRLVKGRHPGGAAGRS